MWHVVCCALSLTPTLFWFTLVVGMSSSAQLAMAGTRRRGMATSLRIQPPQNVQQIALNDSDASTLSSADSDIPPFQTARASKKNMKKLSLSISSAQSSTDALPPPTPSAVLTPSRPRRPSIASLPSINPTATLLHRKDEDGGSPNVPYSDGPVQIIPGIWIGSEDNARDWKGLVERGIRSILNVAKEVSSPFDANPSSQALRPAMSTPNFRDRKYPENDDPTYYPSHVPSGRPAMHYLKLQWSHGQQDLVNDGFKAGMAFADAALQRGEGCLVQYVLCSHHLLVLFFSSSSHQLPMWHLAIGYDGYRACHARCRRAPFLCSARGMGSEGYAGCILFRQGEKSLCWTEHVVSFIPAPFLIQPSLYINVKPYLSAPRV